MLQLGKSNMVKNIFITGAAGFIGFHLARYLHARGDKVIGYDNFNDYYDPSLKRLRALELQKEGIEVVEGDICQAAFFETAIQRHQTTHLVHLAAQAGVRYSLTNPQAYVKSNLEGFVHILETCHRNAPVKLIYASSSSVYGLNTKIPFSIDDPTERQASLYGVTKKTNELMAGTYHHLYGIPVTGLRFFTVYGPWGRPDMAYFAFAKSIMEGRPIEVYNQGQMQRDFTYVDDIVQGTAAAIDLGAGCEIFNLGNHQPEPVLRLVELLEQFLGKKAQIKFAALPPADVVSTYADIGHSQTVLGFSPKVSLEKGLFHFVKWFQQYNS